MRITGYKCDGPRCTVTAESANPPIGWMQLTVRAQVKGRPEGESGPGPDSFDLCSNKCLKMLATERHKAAMELGTEPKPHWMTSRERRQNG